jgi:hypothetical protein
MLRTRAWWALVVPVVVVIAACAGGEASDTSAPEAPAPTTTLAASTTTPASSTTTSPPPTTTTDDGLVGDPEALREFIESIRMQVVSFGYDQFDGIDIPYPDLNSPDPIDALREAFAFEAWLLEVGPHPTFAETYNYPDSPRRGETATRLSTLVARAARYEGVVDGYEIVTARVVPLDEVAIGDHDREGIPPGSIAVEATARGGPEQVVEVDSGTVLEEVEPYEETGIVILSPTDLGWQLYWEGESLP